MRVRILVRSGLAVLLLAALALALYWFWAAAQVREGLARWSEEQRARGYEIAYAGPQIGGFPARLDVRIGAPRVVAPEGWRWSGAAIGGAADFWRPLTLRLDLPRQQELELAWRGQWRRFDLETAAGRGRVDFGPQGRVETAMVELDEVVLSDAAGPEVRARYLRTGLAHRPPTAGGVRDWTLFMNGEAEALTLPDGVPSPLGPTIDRLSFNTSLIGAIPSGPPDRALAVWRDAGGVLEVNAVALAWGPFGLSAEGTAALDEQLRPQGAFTARIRGLPETIDRLLERGVIKPGVALALKLSAVALAAKRDADGTPFVELPITLQDGLFYLGPVAIFRLDPVL